MDDRELVQRLLAKEDAAYRHFYQAHRGNIYKACVFLLGYQDPDAEDVTQEVFLAALRQLPKFEFRSSLYHWLYRIAMYLCYERIRKRKRWVASLDEELDEIGGSLSFQNQVRQEEEVEKAKMLEILESQKQFVGAPCRDLLDLRDGQKKSYAQIAEHLKVPIGTVMSRLARCKEALKNLFLKALKEGSHG